jgi:hypothetical protein
MNEDKKATDVAQTDETNKNMKNPDFLWNLEEIEKEKAEKSGEEGHK